MKVDLPIGLPVLSEKETHFLGPCYALLVRRCWNGDRRLREKYGDEVFEAFEEQTSVLPFQAIIEVRRLGAQSRCTNIYIYIYIFV